MKIIKHKLQPEGTSIDCSVDAKILHVDSQGDDICIWVLDNDATFYEDRKFVVYPTGATIDMQKLKFIGTVKMYDGELIWHVFQKIGND